MHELAAIVHLQLLSHRKANLLKNLNSKHLKKCNKLHTYNGGFSVTPEEVGSAGLGIHLFLSLVIKI